MMDSKKELPKKPSSQKRQKPLTRPNLIRAPQQHHIVKVLVGNTLPYLCIADRSLALKPNELCIIRHEYYEDLGRIISIRKWQGEVLSTETPVVIRHSSLKDQGRMHENQARASAYERKTLQLIQKHKLPMRLVYTHLSFDQRLILFLFTAPGRVDFRELLKDMHQEIPTRIELRQIGPRDQTALIGGLGSCGRQFCCSTFLSNQLTSINIKMAKIQNVSLNPAIIMGACGRLKCCLNYEVESYRHLLASLPRIGTLCKCGNEIGRIIDRHQLLQTVTIQLPDMRQITKHVSEIEILD